MNNIIILVIAIGVLIIIFLIALIIISKSKISNALISVEIANDDINSSLKQKYTIYKDIINYIIQNVSIKENTFENFLNFKIQSRITANDMPNFATYSKDATFAEKFFNYRVEKII